MAHSLSDLLSWTLCRPSLQEDADRAASALFAADSVSSGAFIIAKVHDTEITSNPPRAVAKDTTQEKCQDVATSFFTADCQVGGLKSDRSDEQTASRREQKATASPPSSLGYQLNSRLNTCSASCSTHGTSLWRLKPLLDAFLKEDVQRTGTVPADIFRQILMEHHGGLWPELAHGKDASCHAAGGRASSAQGERSGKLSFSSSKA